MTFAAPPSDERTVQRLVMALLAQIGVLTAQVPNGIPLGGDAAARGRIINAAKRDGLRPGFPDLIVIGKKPGQIGFFEMKRPFETGKRGGQIGGGTLDKDQIWWRDTMITRGHSWALVRSCDDALDALKTWGWM